MSKVSSTRFLFSRMPCGSSQFSTPQQGATTQSVRAMWHRIYSNESAPENLLWVVPCGTPPGNQNGASQSEVKATTINWLEHERGAQEKEKLVSLAREQDHADHDLRYHGAQVRIRMLKDDLEALTEIAEQEGTSITRLINSAIRRHLQDHKAA